MGRTVPLPLIGPVTYYLSGMKSLSQVDADMRRLLKIELAVARGDFSCVARYYGSVPKDSRIFLSAAGIVLIGAIGEDNQALFDEVLADIAAFPTRYGTPEAKLAAEIAMMWVHSVLYAAIIDCPPWFDPLELNDIPQEWRRQVAYLAVWHLRWTGEFRAANALADAILVFDAVNTSRYSPTDIFLKMTKAKCCREIGEMESAARWCRSMVAAAKPNQVVLPFLGILMGPKSVLERALAEDAPELLRKIKALTRDYFRNLVKYHNRFTGEQITDRLTVREFYVAHLLKRGANHQAIAIRTGMSGGRLRNYISAIYQKLGVRCCMNLEKFVW